MAGGERYTSSDQLRFWLIRCSDGTYVTSSKAGFRGSKSDASIFRTWNSARAGMRDVAKAFKRISERAECLKPGDRLYDELRKEAEGLPYNLRLEEHVV